MLGYPLLGLRNPLFSIFDLIYILINFAFDLLKPLLDLADPCVVFTLLLLEAFPVVLVSLFDALDSLLHGLKLSV